MNGREKDEVLLVYLLDSSKEENKIVGTRLSFQPFGGGSD